MSVEATYNLYFDLNGDGDFVDGGEDVSSYRHINPTVVQIGMAEAFSRMGRSNTIRLYLKNSSNIFSPEHASALSGFGEGAVTKFTMTYDGVTKTRYIGRISPRGIKPSVFTTGDRLTEINCDGLLRQLTKAPTLVKTQENITTKDMLLAILRTSQVVPINTVGTRKGMAGYSEKGTTTYKGDISTSCTFDTGSHIFDFVGDNFPLNISTYNAIKRVMDTEVGWFWEDRDGTLKMKGRDYRWNDLATAVDATITDSDASAMPYQFGGGIVSRVEVTTHIRKIDNKVGILAQLDGAPTVNGKHRAINKSRGWTVLELKLRSPAGTNIGARSLVQPVPFVDYRVINPYRTLLNLQHHDITDRVTINAEIVPGGIRWTVINRDNGNGVMYAGSGVPGASQLPGVSPSVGASQRGTRTIDYGTDTRRAGNEDPTGLIEGETIRIDMAGGSSDQAQYLADGILFERSTASGMMRGVGFWANRSHALMVHARDREVGDRIALSETQTGHSGEYYIIGRRDTIAERTHFVEFILEPAPPPLILKGTAGFCEKGTTTYAGF